MNRIALKACAASLALLPLAAAPVAMQAQNVVTQSQMEKFSTYPTYDGDDLELSIDRNGYHFCLWSPMADSARVNIYKHGQGNNLVTTFLLEKEASTGTWRATSTDNLMNKFYTPDYLDSDPSQQERSAGYQMGVTTASELLSNQLSRWLSQISSNVDVGFSYRPGDEVTTDEFELALSTQILNNRVTISANGNMGEKAKTNSNTSITGDFDVEVKLNPQGTLRLKAYSHTDEKLVYNATETVQGVGISYQESFDTFKELWHKYFRFLNRKKITP